MDLPTSDVLALLLAASSDDQKNRRLEELLQAQKALDAQKAEIAALAAAATKDKAAAERIKAAADAVNAGLDGRRIGMDEQERQMADVLNGMNAEKAAWEQVRQAVDQSHIEHEARLEAADVALSTRETAVGEREKFVTAREQAAAEAQGKYESLLARARMLLDLDAMPDVPAKAAKT